MPSLWVMDFNPLICIASNPWDSGAGGWGGMLIYHSSLLNLPSRSQRQVCLTYKKPSLCGMQLSWQSKEMENHYKLKIYYLISMSYFFFPRDALFLPEDLCLDCASGVFFYYRANPPSSDQARKKEFGSLEHTRNIIFSCLMKMMTARVKQPKDGQNKLPVV